MLHVAGIALPTGRGVDLRGRLRAQGSQLWLDIGAAQIARVRLPPAALLLAGAALSPLVDLTTDTGASRIDAVDIDAGTLLICAAATGLLLFGR